MATIDILLATYNGAAFLSEQLASIAAQTFSDWRVILRDDGSDDGSPDMVRRWAEAGGHRLWVVEDGRANLGARDNFAALIAASTAPYFACCDQDDIWLPHKLQRMLDAVRGAEASSGVERAVLAYSDLELVDAQGHRLHRSFHAFAALHTPRKGREVIDLLTQNVATGCATLGNAALRRTALPIPPGAVMHDWWLALVAAGAGDLVDVPGATVRYRQHGGNVSGPVDWKARRLLATIAKDPFASLRRARAFGMAVQEQARDLHAACGQQMQSADLAAVSAFARLPDRPLWARKLYALRNPPQGGTLARRIIVGLCI